MTAEYPKYRKLRIPNGWCIHRTSLYDISPDVVEKFKMNSEDDGWTIFNQYLLHIEYGKDRIWTLEISWFEPFDPEGRFILSISNENWIHKSPTYNEMTADEIIQENEESIKLETRSLEKITESINDAMLRISLENGEYENFPKNVQLQNLRPFGGWRFVKNEFFDIDPKDDLTAEEWKLFGDNLLYLEDHRDGKIRIEMSWFPAFEPSGSYRAKLINENLENTLLEEFSTRNKEEITEYINEAMENKVNNLRQKRTQSERDRRRQMKLQIQRNQKV